MNIACSRRSYRCWTWSGTESNGRLRSRPNNARNCSERTFTTTSSILITMDILEPSMVSVSVVCRVRRSVGRSATSSAGVWWRLCVCRLNGLRSMRRWGRLCCSSTLSRNGRVVSPSPSSSSSRLRPVYSWTTRADTGWFQRGVTRAWVRRRTRTHTSCMAQATSRSAASGGIAGSIPPWSASSPASRSSSSLQRGTEAKSCCIRMKKKNTHTHILVVECCVESRATRFRICRCDCSSTPMRNGRRRWSLCWLRWSIFSPGAVSRTAIDRSNQLIKNMLKHCSFERIPLEPSAHRKDDES